MSLCHRNLNSISAYNYAKLSLLKAYLLFHKFDIICLSETHLNSSNLPDDETLEISGYNLVRSDRPFNSYKHHLNIKLIGRILFLSESFQIYIIN